MSKKVETYQAEELDTSLENELKQYEKKDFKSLVEQINTEYDISYRFMKPKIDEWALRLKLYNNQKRDKEAIGDPLLFTVHQTVLASLYSDRLNVEFGGWERGDEEIADNLNSLALFDYDDMEKDAFDYDWDWEASFFGRALAIFMDFDRERKLPIPEGIDMMTWLRDPAAKSVRGDLRGRGAMRFGGREIRLSKTKMKDSGVYFNFKGLRSDGYDYNSLLDQSITTRQSNNGFSSGDKSLEIKGDNADHRILEWFTNWQGKMVLVSLAQKRQRVVRYTELKYKPFPIIDRTIYPIAYDWDSVSIPDLVEDKQRARSVVQNLGLKSAKTGLHPMYLYNTNKIKDRNALNFEFNKHIPVDGDVSNAIAAVERQGVKQEVQWIMDVLDTAAQKATATPDIQQGANSTEKRTATELNLVSSKVDTRYSLSAKIFGWSDKKFWGQWYQIYKKCFAAGIDEKIMRVVGPLGAVPRKLTRENIVMSTDPDIKIESRTVATAKKLEKLQSYRAFLKDVLAIDPSVNSRFALKQLGKLSGMTKDEVDMILPPTIDELTAQDENKGLEKNHKQEVNPIDDDLVHMDIHNRASDTPYKYAHIEAHKRAMMLKKERPELFPTQQRGTVQTDTDLSVKGLVPGAAPNNGAVSPMPQVQ